MESRPDNIIKKSLKRILDAILGRGDGIMDDYLDEENEAFAAYLEANAQEAAQNSVHAKYGHCGPTGDTSEDHFKDGLANGHKEGFLQGVRWVEDEAYRLSSDEFIAQVPAESRGLVSSLSRILKSQSQSIEDLETENSDLLLALGEIAKLAHSRSGSPDSENDYDTILAIAKKHIKSDH